MKLYKALRHILLAELKRSADLLKEQGSGDDAKNLSLIASELIIEACPEAMDEVNVYHKNNKERCVRVSLKDFIFYSREPHDQSSDDPAMIHNQKEVQKLVCQIIEMWGDEKLKERLK